MGGEIAKVDIQTTADGSQTLYVPSMDEHYHSVKGAITESMHIFIKMGLQECAVEKPRILEVGFGTGLNALLTLQEADTKRRHVSYTSFEKFPLGMNIVEQLEYPNMVSEDAARKFLPIHQAVWGEWIDITPYFSLRKMNEDFITYSIEETYDVIYFDAFAPEKQPDMWSQKIFDNLYSHLNPSGILVTYCAKGVVRRMLQSAGFTVERLAGPPGGKREILRATKPS